MQKCPLLLAVWGVEVVQAFLLKAIFVMHTSRSGGALIGRVALGHLWESHRRKIFSRQGSHPEVLVA